MSIHLEQNEGVQLHFPGMPEQDEFKYELLQGHRRTDGSYKSTEALKTEYVRLTDDIIKKITDGIKVTNVETGEKETKPVDYVVWLDKSARPVSWLTRALWSQLAADKDGNIAPEPQHRYVNIDRNQWTSTIDPEGIGNSDVSSLDPSIIRSLRSIFLKNPNDRQDGLTDRIEKSPTQFDGKTILIVDEVRSSGRTLQYAESFFKRAFPDANVASTHWMGGLVSKDGATGNADIPVWYDDKTDLGRGVGNRNIDRSRLSKVRVQQLGAWFLSTANTEPDPKAKQLRIEIKQLAKDAINGNILVEPSRDREDYDERVLRFNDVEDLDEFTTKRKNQ